MYIIPERIIKNHPGMDVNKTRPVVVLSNSQKLNYKALIVECTTKYHPGYIKLFAYFSKFHNCEKTSYIAIDKIHTIDTKYLQYKNKIGHIVKIPLETRKLLLDFISEIIYSD
jgi:mRNA-degrading endonuclease toxin of MazEF toxin-antitoxin module